MRYFISVIFLVSALSVASVLSGPSGPSYEESAWNESREEYPVKNSNQDNQQKQNGVRSISSES